MKERGVLFSAPMVRALLAGTKTQTRRVVKPQPSPASHSYQHPEEKWWAFGDNSGWLWKCPYGQPGDRLWVRETFVLEWPEADRPEDEEEFRQWVRPHYRATEPGETGLVDSQTEKPIGWRPSIHMPRWASRLTLEITEVRVQRLQDISAGDCEAEGIENPSNIPRDTLAWALWHTGEFESLWESINGPGSWEANPWVWALTFKRVEAQEVAA